MRWIITTSIVCFSFLCCAQNYEKPFTTSEWKDCFEECKESLTKNLNTLKFNEEEMKTVNTDQLCVSFCIKSLRQKRGLFVD
jgi:hypothetical protein